MNIPGIPDRISHAAWLEALTSVGFNVAEARIRNLHTEDSGTLTLGRAEPPVLVVETYGGNVLRIPMGA